MYNHSAPRAAHTRRSSAKGSEYFGVSKNNAGTKYESWMASLKVNGVSHRVSGFRCDTAAALARDRLCAQHWGERGSYNFPQLFGGENVRAGSSADLFDDVERMLQMASDAINGARRILLIRKQQGANCGIVEAEQAGKDAAHICALCRDYLAVAGIR